MVPLAHGFTLGGLLRYFPPLSGLFRGGWAFCMLRGYWKKNHTKQKNTEVHSITCTKKTRKIRKAHCRIFFELFLITFEVLWLNGGLLPTSLLYPYGLPTNQGWQLVLGGEMSNGHLPLDVWHVGCFNSWQGPSCMYRFGPQVIMVITSLVLSQFCLKNIAWDEKKCPQLVSLWATHPPQGAKKGGAQGVWNFEMFYVRGSFFLTRVQCISERLKDPKSAIGCRLKVDWKH